MSEETWAEMHADPKEEMEFPIGMRTFYTKGGANAYTHTDKFKADYASSPYRVDQNDLTKKMDVQCNNKRDGWYGWMGFGGSIMQWHPELKIGFGYVPQDLFMLDHVNLRGACL